MLLRLEEVERRRRDRSPIEPATAHRHRRPWTRRRATTPGPARTRVPPRRPVLRRRQRRAAPRRAPRRRAAAAPPRAGALAPHARRRCAGRAARGARPDRRRRATWRLQSVYFIGTNSRGLVTLSAASPTNCPAGSKLYSSDFVSGVERLDAHDRHAATRCSTTRCARKPTPPTRSAASNSGELE